VREVLVTREPNYHYVPNSIHLEFAPTMVGHVVEVHMSRSVTVGTVVGYYASKDGLTRLQLATTTSSEDGDTMALEAQTFVVVMVH
jgi:hypothetical protein